MSNHSNHLRCVLTVTLENMSVHAPVPLPPLQNNSQYCMKHPVVQPSGTCSVREDGREVGGSSPARELVRKFVRDMLNGKNATIPPAWPGMCGQNVIVSLDKRMKKLCVRSSDPTADVSVQLAVPLTSIASIAFGCCSPGEGRLMATELSVTIFLDEGYGPSIVLEFIDLEERDTFAICLSMFVDGRKVEVDCREKRSL
ncbi:unnamed protein product [Durusdinium trenchii]|uniref:Uncharacterized protein n=1 Tax=Durusdinium trenchii TaxID=1381693 RepID=A0ABP0N547_9DINO